MKKKIKPLPKFKNEQDEREFWSTHDTTDYFDVSKSSRVEIEFDRGIEAAVKSISLRLTRRISNALARGDQGAAQPDHGDSEG